MGANPTSLTISALVAQQLERPAHNRWVVGASPTWSTFAGGRTRLPETVRTDYAAIKCGLKTRLSRIRICLCNLYRKCRTPARVLPKARLLLREGRRNIGTFVKSLAYFWNVNRASEPVPLGKRLGPAKTESGVQALCVPPSPRSVIDSIRWF